MKTLRKAHEVDFWVWKEGWSKRGVKIFSKNLKKPLDNLFFQ